MKLVVFDLYITLFYYGFGYISVTKGVRFLFYFFPQKNFKKCFPMFVCKCNKDTNINLLKPNDIYTYVVPQR